MDRQSRRARDYYFFLGFLTSFFGLLSLATESSLTQGL